MYISQVSQFMKESRVALGWTQQQLAEKINKRRYNISFYESGKTVPPGDVVLKMLQLRFPNMCFLNTSISESTLKESEMQTECEEKVIA